MEAKQDEGRILSDQVESWYKAAAEQTPETLGPWITGLIAEGHDDVGQVHVYAAIMVGAFNAAKNLDTVELDQQQIVHIGHRLAASFLHIDGPFRVQPFMALLDHKSFPLFGSIPAAVFEMVQSKARREMLAAPPNIDPKVIAHWKRIADGQVPFGLKVVRGH